ncbi:fibronectin type III and SPRY domain-containing protein 2 isoform X2 [Acanthochromis polyacanthus]|uniref:fibronectin type III and SPRY domain-containing protein 2 isoform X2 n=1 Tax=Acanthochromis polyacanthus TaxID=80966 RepID=UPI002233E7D8|nr:fibronectin type III and SPRY domain-containing protein 2 isoform X2 [Acanthochromis polyacanthus]
MTFRVRSTRSGIGCRGRLWRWRTLRVIWRKSFSLWRRILAVRSSTWSSTTTTFYRRCLRDTTRGGLHWRRRRRASWRLCTSSCWLVAGRWIPPRSSSSRLRRSTAARTRGFSSRIEEYAKEDPDLTLATRLEFNTPLADLSDVKTMMDSINVVPAPSAPVINPQMPNSATQTSLRVCWSLFSDDTVEYYELYYRPVLEDTPADSTCAPHESKVKVKETHCTVTDLLPNAQYELWVTATNTTGISPASEKALYMTVPSPPVIKQRECTSCPEAALIRWDSGNTNPVDSYTVELSETETDGTESSITESIVAVPSCQCLIQLQAGRRYLISVRAVNIGGPSDRSEVITVSTTGTFFHLLEDTAHPCLSISEDGFTIFYGDEELPISAMALDDNTFFTRCVAVLGDLIPVRGRHYWEVEVDDGTEFRIGIAYEDTERNAYLGANSSSWCMRHILSPTRHKYEFLHNGWSPDLRITVNPVRIGVALNYDRGTLSFFNVNLEQHLHTFQCNFQSHVQPCFSLDNPGALTVHNGIEAPEYAFM